MDGKNDAAEVGEAAIVGGVDCAAEVGGGAAFVGSGCDVDFASGDAGVYSVRPIYQSAAGVGRGRRNLAEPRRASGGKFGAVLRGGNLWKFLFGRVFLAMEPECSGDSHGGGYGVDEAARRCGGYDRRDGNWRGWWPGEWPGNWLDGTSDNFRYLYGIEGALGVVLESHRDARLRVISDVRPAFRELDGERVEFVRWTEEGEREALQGLAVGIMPLEDSVWARGKCSFKMLTYMASGVPVVASPVGMNAEVLGLGEIGFGAATRDEWIEALDVLLGDREKAREMGRRGREVAVRYFSVEALAPRLARELFSVAGRTNPVLDMKLA